MAGEVHTVYDDVGVPVLVAGTQLDGGPVHAALGEFTCVAVYDENYRPLDETCH